MYLKNMLFEVGEAIILFSKVEGKIKHDSSLLVMQGLEFIWSPELVPYRQGNWRQKLCECAGLLTCCC